MSSDVLLEPGSFMKRFLVSLSIALLALLAVELGAAAGLSAIQGTSYFAVVKPMLFLSGVALLFVGVLVGAGFGEVAYYRSPLYSVSDTYRDTITRERLQRRGEQFAFMVVMAIAGLTLIGLRLLLDSLGAA